MTSVTFHLGIQFVCQNQMMCQLKTVRFHGMGRPIIMKGLLPGYGLMQVIFVLKYKWVSYGY
jgi:hypothetical protein